MVTYAKTMDTNLMYGTDSKANPDYVKPKQPVASEGYYNPHSCEQIGYTTGGEYTTVQ